MDNKRVIFLIVAIVLGLVAIVPIYKFIESLQQKLKDFEAKGLYVSVVTANQDIPREQMIQENMIQLVKVNKNVIQPGDLDKISSVKGKYAEVDILEGQRINRNMVRTMISARYLSQKIPEGMRAITISVDKISAVEGLLRPGDYVDVIGTFNLAQDQGQSIPAVINVFQGVKVLATNRNLSEFKASETAGTVTLALRPEDAKLLTYILGWAKIRRALRDPLDT